MFALIRGIPLENCSHVAAKLAKNLNFSQHLNTQVKAISGGNKRKLSTAISLIGNPSVIYLDEPTTGMDPVSKRYFWNAICKLRDNGKSIILTSHSMEECEALCTRLAIMVNGKIVCLGSIEHLKNKFAKGYTLTVKVKKECFQSNQKSETALVEQFIVNSFPQALRREKHQELITYFIPDKSIPWSKMFEILETGKNAFNIEDYSIGQSTLEQV